MKPVEDLTHETSRSADKQGLSLNLDDEESCEIIEEIVTYEVPINKTEILNDILPPVSNSHENSYADDDDDDEDDSFDEKSGSEICETICEIMTYQASVDSNQDEQEGQETLCEIVTYKIKDTYTRLDEGNADNDRVNKESGDLGENMDENSDISEGNASKSVSEVLVDKRSGSEGEEISVRFVGFIYFRVFEHLV